jgi:iron complex transport system substrate-binding protein
MPQGIGYIAEGESVTKDETPTVRIVSLLSSATEIVYELGLDDCLVGISHECDYPPVALTRPRVSRSRFDVAGLDSGQIDREVRRCMEEYGSVYEIDADLLAELRPDVILTQAVCEVCAVPTGSVADVLPRLPGAPQVVSLDAHTLEGIFHTVEQVAAAAGVPQQGERALRRLRGRLERVRARVADRPRPRVLALEWLDPPFAPGHWVPEMVEHAGGDNLWGTPGDHSRQGDWDELLAMNPDHLLLLPCGYDLAQARADAERNRPRVERVAGRAFRDGSVWIGHSAFFSRSGPRVVAGIEALASVLHPPAFREGARTGRLVRWR